MAVNVLRGTLLYLCGQTGKSTQKTLTDRAVGYYTVFIVHVLYICYTAAFCAL